MRPHSSPNHSKPKTAAAVIGLLFVLGLGYQNCSKGFQVQQNFGSDFQASEGEPNTPTPASQPSANQLGTHLQIFSEGNRTCVVVQSGKVRCWGADDFPGDLPFQDSVLPKTFDGLGNVQSVAFSDTSACALANGQVKCWGDNSVKQLGQILPSNLATPTAIDSLTGVMSLVGGSNHFCALLDSKKVKCWGLGIYGQLGDGLQQNSIPVEVSGLTNVTSIYAGGFNSCAIIGNGSLVKCWGIDSDGQIGLDRNAGAVGPSTAPLPVEIGGLTDIKELSVGSNHICALLNSGKLKCWGANDNGELGNNTTLNSKIPVDVQEVELVEHVYAGFSKTCLVTRQGQTKCWGNKSLGPAGTEVGFLIPTVVEGIKTDLSTVVSMGNFHNCILQAGSTVKCWGGNFKGQLGDGSTSDSIFPVNVPGIFE